MNTKQLCFSLVLAALIAVPAAKAVDVPGVDNATKAAVAAGLAGAAVLVDHLNVGLPSDAVKALKANPEAVAAATVVAGVAGALTQVKSLSPALRGRLKQAGVFAGTYAGVKGVVDSSVVRQELLARLPLVGARLSAETSRSREVLSATVALLLSHRVGQVVDLGVGLTFGSSSQQAG